MRLRDFGKPVRVPCVLEAQETGRMHPVFSNGSASRGKDTENRGPPISASGLGHKRLQC